MIQYCINTSSLSYVPDSYRAVPASRYHKVGYFWIPEQASDWPSVPVQDGNACILSVVPDSHWPVNIKRIIKMSRKWCLYTENADWGEWLLREIILPWINLSPISLGFTTKGNAFLFFLSCSLYWENDFESRKSHLFLTFFSLK